MKIETRNKEITKQSYEVSAEAFANNVAELAPMDSIEKFIQLLPPKANIIDIGCGSGRDAKLFSERGMNVTGIDFCSNLLDIAKNHAPLATFQLMDFEMMTFPEASFDGAWAACSLGHSSKEAFPPVLHNIHFILKEKGYFYLALKKGFGETLEKDTRYEGDLKKFCSFFEEEELTTMLQAAQFKILEFNTIEKQFSYQSHSAFRIVCQKWS